MPPRRPQLALALVAVSTLACGKLKPADAEGAAGTSGAGTEGGAGSSGAGTGGAGSGGRTLVTISGTVAPHPLNAALDASDAFTNLRVGIVDPSEVLVHPDAAPIAAMTVDT